MIDSKKAFLFISVISCFILIACSPAYKSHKENHEQEFTGATSVPDYTEMRYWAAHPWKKDLSDSISKGIKGEAIDTSVDVFFLHPTTLTDKESQGKTWNADINDAELNAKTDYSSILYQASVFNKSCRVFAPRYRQAHLYSFFSKDTVSSKAALELAYQDIKAAFDYYLKYYNNGRPIIIASHSQGTFHAGRLLKEYFENKSLQKQLVCAYIIGLSVPTNYFSVLKPCADSSATGCFVSWRTFREGYLPYYVKNETTGSWVVNPLNWRMDELPATRKENKGAVLLNYKKIYRHTNGARITNGVLWINKPKVPFGFVYNKKNYHAGDINLFYLNIRENIEVRKKQFFSQQ
ncbi:MAG: DUF3089 domain-containing protein [Lacibacter sp.]